MTLLTGGLWLIVWFIQAKRSGEKRRIVYVDEYGNTQANSV